jgi:hypothetical protein
MQNWHVIRAEDKTAINSLILTSTPSVKTEQCIFTKISAISGNTLFKKDSLIPQINLNILIYKKPQGRYQEMLIYYRLIPQKVQKNIEYK